MNREQDKMRKKDMLVCGKKASQAEEAMMLTTEEKQAWCKTERKPTTVEAVETKYNYRIYWQEREKTLESLGKVFGF